MCMVKKEINVHSSWLVLLFLINKGLTSMSNKKYFKYIL